MTDLDHRLESAGAALHRAVSHVPTDPITAQRKGVPRPADRGAPRRAVLVAAAALIVLGAGGLVLIERRPDQGPANPPAAASTTAPTAVPAPTIRPLELAAAPKGLKLVAQAVRPANGGNVRAAVFVERDAQANITERVIVRLGALSLYNGTQNITPPPNLPTATTGDIYIDRPGRTVRVEYGLGALGNLALEAYHPDQQTDATLSDQMQQLAASLDVTAGQAISVTGSLPPGWTLATAGVEPEQAVPSYYQAFEVDTPDGGAKIGIENRMTNDPAYPYWVMAQTLQPVQVRGHAGYVTTQDFFADAHNPDSPTVTDPTTSVTALIWEEAPGHWITMSVADQTTEQAVALATTLVPIDQTQWGLPGVTAATTTTFGPSP